jgi:3-dehydrotetronate 4-kinase
MTPAAPPPLLLGAIADDFTGATDLANTRVRAGMRTVQTIGVATRQQVRRMAETCRAVRIDPLQGSDPAEIAKHVFDAVRGDVDAGRPVLVYSSAEPEDVAVVQHVLGKAASAALVESTFAAVARLLVAHGVRRLVVAGGETSGAVVEALGIEALAIGPQIDPGVPWTVSLGEPAIALALKSGNFGAADFFEKALRIA